MQLFVVSYRIRINTVSERTREGHNLQCRYLPRRSTSQIAGQYLPHFVRIRQYSLNVSIYNSAKIVLSYKDIKKNTRTTNQKQSNYQKTNGKSIASRLAILLRISFLFSSAGSTRMSSTLNFKVSLGLYWHCTTLSISKFSGYQRVISPHAHQPVADFGPTLNDILKTKC